MEVVSRMLDLSAVIQRNDFQFLMLFLASLESWGCYIPWKCLPSTERQFFFLDVVFSQVGAMGGECIILKP